MNFIEEKNDLFNYEGKAWLAHCISSDFGMGAGIVVEFNKRYNLKRHMIKNFIRNNWNNKGYCIPVKEYKVFNLITKNKVYEKPTYQTLKQSLEHMKKYAISYKIDTIAMPLIGCGIDMLNWDKVREIVKDVFSDTNLNIIVCRLD